MIFERGYFDSKMVNESKIEKSLQDIKMYSAYRQATYKPTVFISHKHEDLKDLQGVIGLFEELGAIIYIDSMDNKMPNETCGNTAKRLS